MIIWRSQDKGSSVHAGEGVQQRKKKDGEGRVKESVRGTGKRWRMGKGRIWRGSASPYNALRRLSGQAQSNGEEVRQRLRNKSRLALHARLQDCKFFSLGLSCTILSL